MQLMRHINKNMKHTLSHTLINTEDNLFAHQRWS